MSRGVPRLHAVTDARILAAADLAERAAVLAVSAEIALHCRHAATAQAAVAATELFLRLARRASSRVLVNDRADIARATGAHGVHLPADGLPIAAARTLVGPAALVGRSTHAPDDARRAAADGADYVVLGPIWPTPSHPNRPALGLRAVRDIRNLGIPVIAIGGVTADRAAQCLDAGAWGVAAIAALWHAPDPGSAAARFLLSLSHAG